MKRGSNGYTILETLIVISVTAAMFVIAVVALGGRQQEVQFTQSVRDMDSKLQDIINDVAVGFFDKADVDCSVTTPRPTLTISVSTVEQGTGINCISIGKVLQFNPGGQKDKLNIYNAVGRRLASGSSEQSSSLEQAKPVLIGGTNELNSFVAGYQLQWGLHITDITQGTSPAVTTYGGIGFFTSFARNIGDNQVSNDQAVRYGGVPNTTLGESPNSFVSKANKITDNSSPAATETFIDVSGDKKITICVMASDGTRAAIYLGGNKSISTEIDFDNYDTTLCTGGY